MTEEGPTRQGPKASVICLQRSEKHQISQAQTQRANPEHARALPASPAPGRGGLRPGPLPAALRRDKDTITLGSSGSSVD